MSTGYYLSVFEFRFLKNQHSRKLGKIQRVHHFQTKMINFWTIFELGSDKSDLSVELPSRNWLNLITGSVLWAYRGIKKTRKIIPLLMDWVFDVVEDSLTRNLNGTRFHGTAFGTSNLIQIQRSPFTSWKFTLPKDPIFCHINYWNSKTFFLKKTFWLNWVQLNFSCIFSWKTILSEPEIHGPKSESLKKRTKTDWGKFWKRWGP